jgi:hypothetical protein
VRGFIPWLISQRPAVVHKDVLSQADILIAMKLTASQDRDAIGAWIEGQADRQEGKRILAELPRLQRGQGYLWAPGHGLLDRIRFPPIRTFDSSRTPKRGERLAAPRTLAEVDLTAIVAALAAAEAGDPATPKNRRAPGLEAFENDRRLHAEREQELAAANARVAKLEQENRELKSRLAGIATLAAAAIENPVDGQPGPATATSPREPLAYPASAIAQPQRAKTKAPRPGQTAQIAASSDGGLHPAARKLLTAAAQHAPARFTPGHSWRRSQASSRTAGISMPGGRSCAPAAMSPRATAW